MRHGKKYAAFGESKTIREWMADKRFVGGLTPQAITSRIKYGWPVEMALTTPSSARDGLRGLTPGSRKGRLTVTAELKRQGLHTFVLCKCDCGNDVWRNVQSLKRVSFSSCGCSLVRPESVTNKRIRNREYAQANKDRRREYLRNWKQENPGAVAEYDYNRRLRQQVPLSERAAVNQHYKLKKSPVVCACQFCGRLTFSSAERHSDHRIPVSRGGKHTSENLVIACKDCNLRKHAKTEYEFLVQGHRIEEVPLV